MNASECQLCEGRSDWDFLKSFYQRDEMSSQHIKNLTGQVTHLTGIVNYHGGVSQKDRMALNHAHEQIKRLQGDIDTLQEDKSHLEHELHDERNEHGMCRENLNSERSAHQETEKNLDVMFNAHARLNYYVTESSRFDINDLVLEVAVKAQRIHDLESENKQIRGESDTQIAQLEDQLHYESAQYNQEAMAQTNRIRELDSLLYHERNNTIKDEEGHVISGQAKQTKRKRRPRGSCKIRDESRRIKEEGVGEDVLPVIEEEL